LGRIYALLVIGGGQGCTLQDTDLWGLECALQHGLQDGDLEENRKWGEDMLQRLRKLRDPEKDKR